MMVKKPAKKKSIESISHKEASRKNIPTAEYQSIMQKGDMTPLQVAYQRRNRDLDPQLVWRGKDEQDWSDLVVQAPPLYIQEKVHPKVLIDDLKREAEKSSNTDSGMSLDLFADFNGLPTANAKTEFYQHEQNWSNRMILGDSLQAMASLAEREGLRGQVQCIYIDPPYGIKFNSNFQWSTTSKNVKDGKPEHITREPEQVKAFRDTWRDGVHSYLTYLRDRLAVANELLSESGSIFVQIGDENVHRIRLLMDEIFGAENFISEITFVKTSTQRTTSIQNVTDTIVWYAKKYESVKFRKIYTKLERDGDFYSSDLTSMNPGYKYEYKYHNRVYSSGSRYWSVDSDKLDRLDLEGRLYATKNTLRYKRYPSDSPFRELTNMWSDTTVSGAEGKIYVVQTSQTVVQRCLLMSTDPGDLVLDPTCGSGTTAYAAEAWGRRWITIDTSRVALALARFRIMGARYPYYLLVDSREGQLKVAQINDKAPSEKPVNGDLRQGFVYQRVPNISLKTLVNHSEVDVIWGRSNSLLQPLLVKLNESVNQNMSEWQLPDISPPEWDLKATRLHKEITDLIKTRQTEIDESIQLHSDYDYLFDKPYEDLNTARVAGPFTVESISPHRIMGVNSNDELIDSQKLLRDAEGNEFIQMIMDNLKTAGVQQAHKDSKIEFTSLVPWPGNYICAEGKYFEGSEDKGIQKRAAVLIGPEFGTVSRPDLVAAAREAGDADFDVLIICAFNYDAHASDFDKLGRIPVLKARMNADLHMADDLKNTGKGNLFVIFGEPDINIVQCENDQIKVQVNGVDVFHPNTGEIRSNNTDEIACWFIDTDYNEESFFVRQAYFLGANDPYKSLKTTLRAEINEEAWESLHSAVSRPFDKPESGRIAVKVINHLGDEVMKVYSV